MSRPNSEFQLSSSRSNYHKEQTTIKYRQMLEQIVLQMFLALLFLGPRSSWGHSSSKLHSIKTDRLEQGALFQGGEVWSSHLLLHSWQQRRNDQVSEVHYIRWLQTQKVPLDLINYKLECYHGYFKIKLDHI